MVPDVRWRASWAATLAEFGDEFPHGSGLGPGGRTAYDAEACAVFVADRLRYAEPGAVLPDDRVPCSYYWITDGEGPHEAPAERVIGFLALRHRLNDWLLDQGGHIGYSVTPGRRRLGHAGRALGLALDEAARRGLARVLITCDDDNVGSRRTIEGAGGVLEDTRQGRRRYWVEVSSGR